MAFSPVTVSFKGKRLTYSPSVLKNYSKDKSFWEEVNFGGTKVRRIDVRYNINEPMEFLAFKELLA